MSTFHLALFILLFLRSAAAHGQITCRDVFVAIDASDARCGHIRGVHAR